MVKNQPRRTLNRIYTALIRSDGTKTTTTMPCADTLSRQLLAPAERIIDENDHVTLDRKQTRVLGEEPLGDLDRMENCADARDCAPTRTINRACMIGRKAIREAMVSADNTTNTLQWSTFPAFSNSKTFDNSLISLLAYKLGSVAARLDFNNGPLDAQPRANLHFADTVNVKKTDCLNQHEANRHVNAVQQARLTESDIKIHIRVSILTASQRTHNASLNLSPEWAGYSSNAEPILDSTQVVRPTASNDPTLFRHGTRGDLPATNTFEKLVERIYDG